MSVSQLRLDLSTSALRSAIFGQVVQCIDETERYRAAQVMRDASIPKLAHYATVPELERAIDKTVASAAVKQHAKDVYAILAEAEASVHGCPPEAVHFHEVGNGLTVREVLAVCTSIDTLAPHSIIATPVQVGSGTVECEHGTLDVPAPATKAILERYGIPIAEQRLDGELCTPTSAALIAHYVEEFE